MLYIDRREKAKENIRKVLCRLHAKLLRGATARNERLRREFNELDLYLHHWTWGP